MSDEESFVILGSSPLSSLEVDGNTEHKSFVSSTSLESDAPGSNFSSLKKSQLIDLQNAQEPSEQKSIVEETESLTQQTRIGSKISSNKNCASLQEEPISLKNMEFTKSVDNNTESKLWSRSPQVHTNSDDELALSFEDCGIKSPLNSKKEQRGDLNISSKVTSTSNSTEEKHSFDAHNPQPSVVVNSSLASSFLMGEINADVLKASVYSQFPSISMHSSAEEIEKLQNMVTENMQLKALLKKVNNTMRFFHNSSLQWQEKINNMESTYKRKLDDCQNEIEMLRKENQTLQDDFKSQIEAIEIAREKDREETIKDISEKNSLVENMRAQIVKLEKQQLASFEVIAHNDKTKSDFDNFYISRDEHRIKIKELEKKLSELYASNLDLEDMRKQYIDEINCLRVNLTAAEELAKANRAAITFLHTKDQQKLERIKQLEMSMEDLRLANAEQKDRILLLEQQTEVFRKDFELEREGRSTALQEKNSILQDLKNLQKRNQELIQEHQKLVDNYERRLSSSAKSSINRNFVSAAPAVQTYINNPQRPIRNLPSISSDSGVVSQKEIIHSCPLCNKAFKSLSILQSHVQDCIDKN